jgi:Cdc6-like AAA superfamily ATPase
VIPAPHSAGKSHTVRKVLQQLLASHPDAATITWVNCMSINTASEVYAQVAASADGSSNFAPLPTTTSSSSGISSSCLDDDDLAADINNCSSISSSCSTGVTTYQQLVERLGKPPSSSSSSSTGSRPAPKSYRASRTSSKQQQASRGSNENDAAPTRTPGSKRSSAKDQQATTNSSSSSRCHIIVLDEIDNLAKKSHAELVQLFLLPQQPGLQLLLIGIANSIDLTERTLPELKLRMASPQLLCFPAYSTKQLGCILAACMEALPAK